LNIIDPALFAIDTLLEFQKPEPILTVSEWSDLYRTLSQIASAEHGKWRTERTPYLREIMDALSPSNPLQEVVFMKGSQIGGTEAGLNWILFLIDYSPSPTLVVQPTEALAKRFSRQRLETALRETARLHGKVRTTKKDPGNSVLMKEFPGGFIAITGANSAVGLRSMPIRNLMLDEIDGYPIDLDGEGDPIALAEARARTFARRKIFKVSSPTIKGRSRIEKAYEETDQRRFFVPCPHCQHFQIIEWSQIKWERNRPETAHMVCVECDEVIEEFQKTKMMAQGKWIAQNKGAPKHSVGFHLNALYSPVGWYSWKDAARQFMQSKDSPVLLRVFMNTVLGETWKEKGDAPDWLRIFERRENYKFNTVPKGGLFLTAGVDIQKNRIEVEVTAWGRNKESWSIDYRTFLCDPSDIKAFQDNLEPMLAEEFTVEGSQTKLPISMMAVDTGYNTQVVYAWAREKQGKVMCIKGQDNVPSIVGRPSILDVSHMGKMIRRGVQLWPVGTSVAKTELYGWLGLQKPVNEIEPYPPGFCHFPTYPEDYFKMLTAEQIRAVMSRGYRKYQWEKIRDRNEALDARVYSRAAAYVYGLDRFSEDDWRTLEDNLRKFDNDNKEEIGKKIETKGGIPIKRSSFWGN
jgi:phage terminase large subunit GpA-like protein